MPSIPDHPIVVRRAIDHSMGDRLPRYIASRTHEYVDEASYRRIVVIGSYDRSLIISRKEKTDKRENWQRPTAELSGSDLVIHCFPGRAYVFHYASLIATHLAVTNRNPDVVKMVLPSVSETWSAVQNCGFDRLRAADTAVVAAGNDHLAPEFCSWIDYTSFAARTERVSGSDVAWLAVKHSFWGDIAYHIGRSLAQAGFRLVVFIGKLGSLVPSHIPNGVLATGSSSICEGQTVSWNNIFQDVPAAFGRHVTLPSVLQETTAWVDAHRGAFEFVDPEIGHFAKGVVDEHAAFSYLHIVSDNVVERYSHDLSNEREAGVVTMRTQRYRDVRDIVSRTLSANLLS